MPIIPGVTFAEIWYRFTNFFSDSSRDRPLVLLNFHFERLCNLLLAIAYCENYFESTPPPEALEDSLVYRFNQDLTAIYHITVQR